MIDAEREIGFAIRSGFAVLATRLADDELVSAERVFRAEIAGADAVGTAEQARQWADESPLAKAKLYEHMDLYEFENEIGAFG